MNPTPRLDKEPINYLKLKETAYSQIYNVSKETSENERSHDFPNV